MIIETSLTLRLVEEEATPVAKSRDIPLNIDEKAVLSMLRRRPSSTAKVCPATSAL